MSESTPMTMIKTVLLGVAVFLAVGYLAYAYWYAPAHPSVVVPNDYTNNGGHFVSGEVISGSAKTQLNVYSKVRPYTPSALPSIEPTTAPPQNTPTPAPAMTYPTYYPNPSPLPVVTTNPVWNNPTPKPAIAENNQYIDERNYLKTSGMNLQYPLKKALSVKGGTTFELKTTITNLKPEEMRHLTGTLTVTTLNDDPNYNIVLPPQKVIDTNVNLATYDTYTLDEKVSIPPYKGHYKLYFTINGDNGANGQIMQEVYVT